MPIAVMASPQQEGMCVHIGDNFGAHSSGGEGGVVFLGSKGHLLHRATPLRLGDIIELHNTYKQTELGKMRRQRNMFPMKEQNKTSEKELN